MPPTVSIIVTCYNLERYIGDALASVAAQDYSGETELIVVDDASEDGSAARIAEFPHARLIRMPQNGGSMLALLAGMEQARGEYLFFLDGDDVWEPGKLSAVMRLFEQDPDMVFATHDLRCIDALGVTIAKESRVAEVMDALQRERWSETIRTGILTQDDYVWLGSAFAIRRSLARLDEYRDFIPTLPDPRQLYQDWPLAFWCASLPGALTFGFSPEKLFRYRLHQANHSGDARTAARASRNFRRSARTLEAMLAIAERNGVAEVYRRVLERHRRFYDWVADLYQGRRASTFIRYPVMLPYLAKDGLLAKESLRFAGIQLLGPDRFARLAAGRLRD
jgi:glycosyltransferase involved in cell wall biosynthesis